MVNRQARQPADWVAWAIAAVGWLCSVFVWASGGPEERFLSIVATVIVVATAIAVAVIAIIKRSTALGVLALITLLAPLLILIASFATW